jgi:terminase, large subunit
MLSASKICRLSLSVGIKPDPTMSISEWSDKYRIMPKGYAESGRYRTSRTPYLKEIMDCLSPSSPIRQIKIMKGTQMGFTEIVNNWICHNIHINPGPMLMVLPTVDIAQKHSKKKLTPTIKSTPILQGKIRENRSRDSGNTILLKEYPGGSIALAGSNSAASFRSDSIRDLALDDIDGYPLDVDGEGDPCDLAINRTDAYANRKILKISTPTNKGTSRIEAEYEDSDQRKYHVPCPFCNQKQELLWGGREADHGIKFEYSYKIVKKIWYECKFCHKAIDEHHKTWMLERGEWIPQNLGHPDAGFHLNSLYSPLGFRSWIDIASEFLKAKKNPKRLKRWVNTRQGLPFEEDGSQPEWNLLKGRAEPYKITEVPLDGLLLTCGVDTQDNRLAVLVTAWGRGEECWIVYWGELFGDPAQQDVWRQLDDFLNMPFRHASGNDLRIISACIDSGGHCTQDVYNYARLRPPRVVAIKSASIPNKPIIGRPSAVDVTYRGVQIKGGCQLWTVGSDTAKGQIYGRLRMTERGPGMIHFPIGLDDDFYIQLTAEKQVTRFDRGGYPKSEWVKVNERNEALDCMVYSTAAAVRAGIARMNWRELEESLCAKSSDRKLIKTYIGQKQVAPKSKWMS